MINFIKKLRKKYQDGTLKEMWIQAKWMYQYSRKYWVVIVYYILLGIVGTIISLAGSVASKNLIDTVTGQDTGNMPMIISIIIGMALGGIAISAVTNRISTKITLKINKEIQGDIYDKIMNRDWESMSEYHSGDILNRFNGDVSTVASSTIGWIPSLITKSFQFVGILAVILYYDPTMALIALLSAPITMIISKMLMKRMRDHNKKMRIISSEIMSFNQESFFNIQQVKAFNLLDLFSSRLRQVQEKYINMSLDYNKFSIYSSSFMSIVGLVVSYSCFGWGVYRLWTGHITYGTMTLFLQLAGSLSGSFKALIGMVPSAISATTSAGRIMDIVELPRERFENNELVRTIKNTSSKGGLSIRLKNLQFTYKTGKLVLDNADLEAYPNEIVALVGPSGQGKTTTIRLLLGLLNPSKGNCYLEDNRGRSVSISASTRCFFSYVPQGNTIFSGTIADNMRMVKEDATDEEIIEALKIACAYEFVEELPEGINNKIGERGNGFSEGQNQRLSIARALLRKSPILLLDEATSALDVATERKVLRNIMGSHRNRTCIVTTHRPSVLSMCDRVYSINHCKIEQIGEEAVQKLVMDF